MTLLTGPNPRAGDDDQQTVVEGSAASHLSSDNTTSSLVMSAEHSRPSIDETRDVKKPKTEGKVASVYSRGPLKPVARLCS